MSGFARGAEHFLEATTAVHEANGLLGAGKNGHFASELLDEVRVENVVDVLRTELAADAAQDSAALGSEFDYVEIGEAAALVDEENVIAAVRRLREMIRVIQSEAITRSNR